MFSIYFVGYCKTRIVVLWMETLIHLCSSASYVKALRRQLKDLCMELPTGYSISLKYAELVGNATILEHMKKDKNVGRLLYHQNCQNDLYNKFVVITKRSAQSSMAEKESSKFKRRRTCSEFSASTAGGSTGTQSVKLLNKNVCILCNRPAHLFKHNPEDAWRRCSVSDNLTVDRLKATCWKQQSRKGWLGWWSPWTSWRDQWLVSRRNLVSFAMQASFW